MRELREIGSNESRALMWTILTAARTAETIGGKRSEINGDMWIHFERENEGQEGKNSARISCVAPQALALLGPKAASRETFYFPAKSKRKMWHADMLNLLKGYGPARVTLCTASAARSAIGFRMRQSTNSTLAEIALSHRVGTKTEKAYARSVHGQ